MGWEVGRGLPPPRPPAPPTPQDQGILYYQLLIWWGGWGGGLAHPPPPRKVYMYMYRPRKAIVHYFTSEQWATLTSDGISSDEKSLLILDVACSLGLRCPTEPCYKFLTSLWMVTSMHADEVSRRSREQKHILYQHLKSEFIKTRRTMLDPIEYMTRLPLTPIALLRDHPATYKAHFLDGCEPVECATSIDFLRRVDLSYSCRGGCARLGGSPPSMALCTTTPQLAVDTNHGQLERMANMFMDRIGSIQTNQQRMVEMCLGGNSQIRMSDISTRLQTRRLPTLQFESPMPAGAPQHEPPLMGSGMQGGSTVKSSTELAMLTPTRPELHDSASGLTMLTPLPGRQEQASPQLQMQNSEPVDAGVNTLLDMLDQREDEKKAAKAAEKAAEKAATKAAAKAVLTAASDAAHGAVEVAPAGHVVASSGAAIAKGKAKAAAKKTAGNAALTAASDAAHGASESAATAGQVVASSGVAKAKGKAKGTAKVKAQAMKVAAKVKAAKVKVAKCGSPKALPKAASAVVKKEVLSAPTVCSAIANTTTTTTTTISTSIIIIIITTTTATTTTT